MSDMYIFMLLVLLPNHEPQRSLGIRQRRSPNLPRPGPARGSPFSKYRQTPPTALVLSFASIYSRHFPLFPQNAPSFALLLLLFLLVPHWLPPTPLTPPPLPHTLNLTMSTRVCIDVCMHMWCLMLSCMSC